MNKPFNFTPASAKASAGKQGRNGIVPVFVLVIIGIALIVGGGVVYVATQSPQQPYQQPPINITIDQPTSTIEHATTTTTNNSFITVIAPNRGETLLTGTPYEIRWLSSGMQGATVDIVMATCLSFPCGYGQEPFYSINKSVPNTGSYKWSVGNAGGVIVATGSYTIRICRASDIPGTAPCDVSDYAFKIVSTTQPSITLLSPNGGEAWQSGSTQVIRWNAQGFAPNATVGMWLLKGLGHYSWPPTDLIVTGISAAQGNYSFKIPSDKIPEQYKIYIKCVSDCKNNGYNNDYSDEPFTITYATSSQPSITVLSPNGGETWVRGSVQTVLWTSKNIPIGSIGDVAFVLQNMDSGAVYSLGATNNIESGISVRVPTVPVGRNYKVQATTADYGHLKGVSDFSNAPFTITYTYPTSTQPSITVLSPNGGETFRIGGRLGISYIGISYNIVFPGTASDGKTLFIRLEKGGSSSYTQILADTPVNSFPETFWWAIPATLLMGNDYKVTVYVKDSSGNIIVQDSSNAPFTITAQ